MNRPTNRALACQAAALLALPWWAAYAGTNPPVQDGFPVTLDGSRVRAGSVALGDLNQDGDPDVVVGTVDGKVHAYTGTGGLLWERDTGDMAIESKPAIADLDGDGVNEVVVSAGSTTTPNADGGLYVISHLGAILCTFLPIDRNGDGFLEGIYSSPAVADLDGDGDLEIAFAGFDRWVRVIHHGCTTSLWENDVIDTSWSSPAIGDVDGDGQLDVVVGVASDDQPAANGFQEGGLLHVYDGKTGAELPGFPKQIDETIQSSPALGDLTGDGRPEIVVGTGRCWADPICAPDGPNPNVGEEIHAWDLDGNVLPGWPVAVPGTFAFSSPALGDLDGDGDLEVVINTVDPDDPQNGLGRVYALDGDGSFLPGWPTRPTTPVNCEGTVRHTDTAASPVLADVTGDGGLEVLLPSSFELVVWDRFGTQLTREETCAPPDRLLLLTSHLVSSSPAVGDVDGDGDLEVVVGGAVTGGGAGALYAWDLDGGTDDEALAWPMFRRSSDNLAAIIGGIFADGFESGDTSVWQ